MRKSGRGPAKHIKSRHSHKTKKRLEIKRAMLAAKKQKKHR